ncbi:hypothetical protein TNCV_4660751 [Trichonephila clavipes]|uniref:Uncharacterized protein n=1 Tax=Trichonephila clavipes TaxID=2585209 RepID=A0A8X6SL13_TRICX|nr:hypothetical protein TNCV_4660751 [Trichonephila clavipes]
MSTVQFTLANANAGGFEAKRIAAINTFHCAASGVECEVFSNHGQVTRTTSELAPRLQTTTPRKREDFEPQQIKPSSTSQQSGSSVTLGFEYVTRQRRPQFSTMTTWLPWPPPLGDNISKIIYKDI